MELSGQLYATVSLTQLEIPRTHSVEDWMDTLEKRKPLSRVVGLTYRVEQNDNDKILGL